MMMNGDPLAAVISNFGPVAGVLRSFHLLANAKKILPKLGLNRLKSGWFSFLVR